MTEIDASEAEVAFAREKLTELMRTYDDDALLRLCDRSCRRVVPDLADAAPFVIEQVDRAMRDRIPWSLVRVGDGEGNALALRQGNFADARALGYFNLTFESLHGTRLDIDEAKSFVEALEAAIVDADCVGFGSVHRPLARTEAALMEAMLGDTERDVRGMLGIMSARRFLEEAAAAGCLQKAAVTSAWVHLGLLTHLGRILESARDVLVLNGRQELADAFRCRLGNRLREFVVIPAEGERPETPMQSHFHKHFPQLVRSLRHGLSGALVLVGGGLIGKIYCHAAKQGGAVAIDLGSAFDVLANRRTRPVHRMLDLAALRWL